MLLKHKPPSRLLSGYLCPLRVHGPHMEVCPCLPVHLFTTAPILGLEAVVNGLRQPLVILACVLVEACGTWAGLSPS